MSSKYSRDYKTINLIKLLLKRVNFLKPITFGMVRNSGNDICYSFTINFNFMDFYQDPCNNLKISHRFIMPRGQYDWWKVDITMFIDCKRKADASRVTMYN